MEKLKNHKKNFAEMSLCGPVILRNFNVAYGKQGDRKIAEKDFFQNDITGVRTRLRTL